ncbi:MFS transporter [Cumulibacter manganitolerans]|uniref:MFS transporter n=1 Tax=Cumulibacter manganitolerans TaxID=1884992 RepID=UPI00129741B9|nr:MFS transporter [Cumulibacter manganitolerans]
MSSPTPVLASRPALVVAVLSLTGMTVSIMQTLVVPLLPHLPGILHAAPDDATWVLTMTLMFGAVCTPIAGRLGDMVGKKRMLLISISAMVVGSVLCALATGLPLMLVGRAFQGAAIGSIALGISLMRDVLPRERLGSSVALMSATLGIGGAIGLPLASIVAEHLSWHYLFIGSAVLGAIAIVGVVGYVPESPVRSGGSFDVRGALTLSALLVAVLFAFTKTRAWGWGDARVLGCFAAAVVLALVFVRTERRRAHPLVDMRVTARPTVKYTNLASILVGFAMYSSNLVITQLIQAPVDTGYGFGKSMVVAGLCAAPMGLLMMAVSPFAARLITHHGPRFTFMAGIAVIAFGFTLGVFLLQEVWEAVIVTMFVGTGIALSYAAAPTLIMRAAPPSQTAAANSVNTLSRSIGTSLASAVHGAILATAFVAGGTSYGPFDPFQLCFALAVGACLVALVLAWRIPPTPAATTAAGDAGTLDGSGTPVADDELDSQRVSHPARRVLVVHRPRSRRTASRRPAGHRPRK